MKCYKADTPIGVKSFGLLFVFLFFITELPAQTYFEGEIIYRSEGFKKVKGKVVKDSAEPVSFVKASFKNGNWIQVPDEGYIEYMHFDRATNKIYWKLRHVDTLFFEDGRFRRPAETDPGLKIRVAWNTDTILGKVCNSLIIQTKALKLTLVYNNALAVNPAWYGRTKIGFYDLIYSTTKSIFLKYVVETKQTVSVTEATEIYDTNVDDDIFPALDKLPRKKL
jgi:hypothetical protein